MANSFLQTPIEYLKGVGPAKAELLKKELSIFTFQDLLEHYPFRYVDRTKFYKINEINTEMPYVQIKGFFVSKQTLGEKRGKRLSAQFSDGEDTIELVWFQGYKWIDQYLELHKEYIIFGKPALFNNKYNIAHPELELVEKANPIFLSGLMPVYPLTEKIKTRGIDSKAISKMIKTILPNIAENVEETLPEWALLENHLVNKKVAIFQIHQPENIPSLEQAKKRLKFDELFFIQLRLLKLKANRKSVSYGYVLPKVGDYFNSFYNNELPFALTNAQKRVVKEIRTDMITGKQMNRMLQGDVGSGKTLVALLCMLIALDNGFQACLMAPTEILANQHFESFRQFMLNMNVNVGLLTGSTKKSKRKLIDEQLQNGEMHILIGTHALIEDHVKFKNLGLVVIDEQHRFGVEQRYKLWKKNEHPPHVLVMTATPIPRTLAMTLYGDLDTSVIDELPPGRKPITTTHRFDESRMAVFGFIKEQIAKGRQIYIVYPLIQESEKMDYKDLMDGYESISRSFPLPDYAISILHGKMKPADKEYEMMRFARNETQIMVATTVIEVGVNIPNASVMIIESAERFGLSQLHQLRGRVGRGADQSFCILMTSNKLSAESKTRIETMCRTNDGFEIAEVDLKLRGPGDIEGTQQSGVLNLKLADLVRDAAIMLLARDAAEKLLTTDPEITSTENQKVKEYLQLKENGRKTNWSKVS